MPVYADIAATNIQSWLARTPRLKGRRGASQLLREATSAATIEPMLPEGVTVNADAGDIDGVVSLIGSDHAKVQAGAAAVAAHLRAEIPGLPLRAATAEAKDYFTAYKAIKLSVERGHAVEWEPSVSEVPFLRMCAFCGVDPAAGQADLSPDHKAKPVCADCRARLAAAGRTSDSRNLPATERRVSTWLGEVGLTLDFPDDFSELAGMGAGDGTHIATIFIDGNRVGTLFSAIAEGTGDAKTKADLASGIDGASEKALVEAARIIASETHVPMVPHLVGGDDLLASVPAALAWPFTRTYLRVFGEEIAEWMKSKKIKISGPIPSASAGIVFHHLSHPFPMAVDQAARALAVAKKEFTGREAAVAWADVSAEGFERQDGLNDIAGPRTLAWIEENWDTLVELRRVRASQRAGLLRAPDGELAEHVRRMGTDSARTLLRKGKKDLRDGLMVARWMEKAAN